MSHILIIDDQESIRHIMAEAFKNKGYQVTLAGSGKAGLKTLSDRPNEFNVVMADINMPELDGFEFLKIVKQDYPNLPVVFCTSTDQNAAEVIGQELKVDGIISKPFNIEEAVAKISAAIANSQKS